MVFYVCYLLSLLTIIAFSPTREFSFSLIAFASIIPAIGYCMIKFPSKLQLYLFLLLILSLFAGKGTNFKLETNGQHLSDLMLIASSSIWFISYLTMKLGLKSRIPRTFFKLYFSLFFLVGFYIMVSELLVQRSLDEGSNSAYYVLPVLPLVMYYLPRYKIQVLLITFIVLLFTIKRSSIIIIFFSLIWLYYCWKKGLLSLKISQTKLRIITLCLICFIILFGGVYLSGIINRFSGIVEDGGSHRDLIYLYALDILNNADINHLLLGNGPRFFWYSNSKISAAHNDFLEISISCGLVGLIIFIFIHIQLITWLVKLVKMRKPIAALFGISYISFLVWNLVGCQFAYQSGAIGVCMFWALVENKIDFYEKNTIRGDFSRHIRRVNEYHIQKN